MISVIQSTAVIAVILLVFSVASAKKTEKRIKKGSEYEFKRTMYYFLDIPYTVFITLISIFPLLGMLGTVLALLNLDLSGETSALKNNFFQALDTTEWGIIFAVVFKVLNAFFQPYIEAQIEKLKKLLEKSYE
ncbi:MAG: MotA/TolQ/ExbB proton channel family protein [Ruminococcus sp.]|nr:MotA/TolQ/ExbB proton channel family protein [Ruminococcus sp.]